MKFPKYLNPGESATGALFLLAMSGVALVAVLSSMQEPISPSKKIRTDRKLPNKADVQLIYRDEDIVIIPRTGPVTFMPRSSKED